jgi:hypothetical protein
MRPHYFNLASLALASFALLLICCILIIMLLKSRRETSQGKWKLISDLLIRKAIFFEEEAVAETDIHLTSRAEKLLKKKRFRKVLTDEIINARKNVSGSSAENLKKLYLQLNLHQHALSRLNNHKWYIKAQVIQELSIMDLKEYLTKIYRFINNRNDLLRMEAQIAVVRLYGFEGLRFLDLVAHPVSEWQQIKLLHELANVPAENFNGIEKWLNSANKSVVIFALKITRLYHRFELHDAIAVCLADDNAEVRYQTIISLGEIYNHETSGILIGRLLKEEPREKMAILKVLQNIGTTDDNPVLLDQLNSENAAVKVAAARALSKTGPDGYKSLLQHPQANMHPLSGIIKQISSEVPV